MEEKSIAMIIIDGMKEQMGIMKEQINNITKIMYILLVVNILTFGAFAISCYDSIKIRDDIGTTETTVTQESEGSNNYIGNNGDITNG